MSGSIGVGGVIVDTVTPGPMVELRVGRGTPVSAESASRSIVERVKSPGTVSPAGNPILSDAESRAPQWGQLAAAGGVSALQLGQFI